MIEKQIGAKKGLQSLIRTQVSSRLFLFSIFILSLTASALNADDPPEMQWHKGYGTTYGNHVHEGMQTSDGGYIGIGQTWDSSDYPQMLVIKTDSSGNKDWQKVIGTSNQYDIGICVAEVSDGFICGGGLYDSTNMKRALVKLNKTTGNIVSGWPKYYSGSQNCCIRGIEVLDDGSIVATGYKNAPEPGFLFICDDGDGFIMKTNAAGTVQWDEGLSVPQGTKVRQDGSGFAVCSTDWYFDGGDHQDAVLIKTNSSGTETNKYHFGGTGGEHCYDFDLTFDGGYILGGHTTSYGVANWDYYLVKVNSSGVEEWHRTFGQPRGYNADYIHDEAYGVRQTSDGGYIIAGGSGDEYEYSECGHPAGCSDEWKAYVVRTDSDGNKLWEDVYPPTSVGNTACEYIGLTSDGGYILFNDTDAFYGSVGSFAFGFMKIATDPSTKGPKTISLTNPSFESGATGWSNISVGHSEFYSPVDGEYYATRSGGAAYTSQLTNHTIATGETFTLTVWARSTNNIGNTAETTVEVSFYNDANDIISVTKDVNPVRLLGAPRTYPNDDGGNVWLDNGYRMEFADHVFYQLESNDPLYDSWNRQNDSDYDHDMAVGPIITPQGLKACYNTYYEDSPPFYSEIWTLFASGIPPNYDWTLGDVVLSHDGSEDPWVIDAHLYYDDDTGRLWMSWGGLPLRVTEMDPSDGQLLIHPASPEYDTHPAGTHIAVANWSGDEWSSDWAEGPALFKHNGYWYFFASYGNLAANYTIRGGRGTSPTGPFYDKDGVDLMTYDSGEAEYGNTIFLGADGGQANPGHPHIWQESGKYYMGYDYTDEYDSSGTDRFGIRELHWVDDWPVVAYTPISVTFSADDYPDCISHKLGVSFRNTGSGSNAAFDYVSLICSNYKAYSGGTGASYNPFIIATPNDMEALGQTPDDWQDNFFLVISDINLAGYDINTIGFYKNEFDNKPFTGNFDGNNHTISNLVMNDLDGDSMGLFGYVEGSSSVLKDLHLADVNIIGDWMVGSLVGKLTDGSVTNCTVLNAAVSGKTYTGGLIGHLDNGNLRNCSFDGNIKGQGTAPDGVGGLVGFSDNGSIENCYANSEVTSTGETYNVGGLVGKCFGTGISASSARTDVNAGNDSHYVGGLIGFNFGSASNSYCKGSVSGFDSIGGLVGYNGVGRGGPTGGTLFNCYAAAGVSGSTGLGGVTGYDNGTGTYTACFWDADLNPDVNGISNAVEPNVIAKTTTEMQTQSTFTDAGWDFIDIWKMCNGSGYPMFLWQNLAPPDYLCPEGIDFFDYGFFANHWLLTGCADTNDCNSTDLDFSGAVDINDFDIFTNYWLFGK